MDSVTENEIRIITLLPGYKTDSGWVPNTRLNKEAVQH